MEGGGVFAYVSNAASREIIVLRLNPDNGDLVTLQRIPVTGKVMPLAVSPDRRFLYAGLRSEPYSIACFEIDPAHGTLTHLGNVLAPDSMNYICTDHSGRFLFAALNLQDRVATVGRLSVSAIGADGVVKPAHQIVTTAALPHSVLPDPTNRYVFAGCIKGDIVARHAFDITTGTMSPDALPPVSTKPGDGPRHIRFHPNRRFMYVLNEYSGSLIAYVYEPGTGETSELQSVSALPPGFTGQGKAALAADLHLTPDGRFLYASARGPLSLTAYRVNPESGMLVTLATYPTIDEPRGFAIDPHGQYLIVAGRRANCVACHAINRETGMLTPINEYPMGNDPNWIEIIRLQYLWIDHH